MNEKSDPQEEVAVDTRIGRTIDTTADLAKRTVRAYRDIRSAVETLQRGDLPSVGPRSMFGLGRRQFVPSDEIHVVVGAGKHIAWLDKAPTVYGSSSASGAMYWRNGLTQVTRMVTASFEVPVDDIQSMDMNNVSFMIDAFCQAALDTHQALVAAEKVGGMPESLVSTIEQITAASLSQAAAKMTVEEVLANRQKLEDLANDAVEAHLKALGYRLIVLTVSRVYGEAVALKEKQALAEVSKEATIKTNAAQLLETQNKADREQKEAEIHAAKEEQVAAQQRIALLKIEQGDHGVALERVTRQKTKADADNQAALAQVELQRQVDMAQAAKDAEVTRLRAEQGATLARLQLDQEAALNKERQARQAELDKARITAEAEQKKLAQEETLRLQEAKAQAERGIKDQEETAAAERAKRVMTIQTAAEADAIQRLAEAEASRTTTQATAEANAAVQRAKGAEVTAIAQVKEAEATRAKAAAQGLAEAEVAERRAQAALIEAEAEKARGLAQAAITEAQAKVDAEAARLMEEVRIVTQERLAQLYAAQPVLVELERMRTHLQHDLELARIKQQGQIQMLQAIAPHLDIRIFGNGGQLGRLLTELATLQATVDTAQTEAPMLQGLLSNGAQALAQAPGASQLLEKINPRIFSNLTIADLVQQVSAVAQGDESISGALQKLQADGNFQLIGNIPVLELLTPVFVGAKTSENGAVPPV